ncbi:MAG: DUF6504 family protein [Candidatus Acetothermia bacterium]|nr:DUF6504 family protein [Candidatus Acetothermia bacterium]MDH7504931.1 DUF6504 family protein [Candidatus Acetothermia bacterium]
MRGKVVAEPRFIAEEVEVRFAERPGLPSAFTLQGKEHRIVEILSARQALDFKRSWWRRRHRDYYLVRTDQGRTFELYFHRGPGRRYWVLYREL